jgi:hypothetical protein
MRSQERYFSECSYSPSAEYYLEDEDEEKIDQAII